MDLVLLFVRITHVRGVRAFKRIGNYFHRNMAKNKYVRQIFYVYFPLGERSRD
jgi:hypothetical protein